MLVPDAHIMCAATAAISFEFWEVSSYLYEFGI
jgi:hypothetical protein